MAVWWPYTLQVSTQVFLSVCLLGLGTIHYHHYLFSKLSFEYWFHVLVCAACNNWTSINYVQGLCSLRNAVYLLTLILSRPFMTSSIIHTLDLHIHNVKNYWRHLMTDLCLVSVSYYRKWVTFLSLHLCIFKICHCCVL